MIQVCGPKCWFAKREKCTCSCDGANHKIGPKILDLKNPEEKERGSEYLAELERKFKEYRKLRKKERRLKRKGVETPVTDFSSLVPRRTKKLSKLLK